MAEAVAAVASIIAIIQISDRVITACKFYIQSASETPSELRAILVEISALRAILDSLRFLQSYAPCEPALWKQLSGKQGPLEELKRLMLDLEKLFPQDDFRSSFSAPPAKKAKLLRASLAWPFKARRAQELLKTILQQKTNLSLALSIEISHDVKQIKQSTGQMHAMLTDAQRFELYRWLEVTDPSPIHYRSRKLHKQDTCHWMLRSQEWNQWIAGQLRCLWIHGIPGAGKTVLTSFLIEQLESHVRPLERVGHAYYYCYFGHNQDESGPFLRWTISQLCRQSGKIPKALVQLHKHGRQPDLADLLIVLESLLQQFDSAYVILDAVDESKPREDLLRTIRDLATDARFSNLHCLVTSRRYVDIENVLDPISRALPMSNELIEDDIRRYVESTIRSGPKTKRWPVDLRSEVEGALVSGSKGMFRWVVCQLDRLRRLKPERSIIRHAIATLPKTLDDTYERIFLEISEDDHAFVRDALRWICFHQHVYDDKAPFGADILIQATELSMKEALCSELDQDYDLERLRDIFGCLLHVSAENFVVLAHYTVKEYLESDRIGSAPSSFFRIEPGVTVKSLVPIVLTCCQKLNGFAGSAQEETDDYDDAEVPAVFVQRLDVYCVVTSAIFLSEDSTRLVDESSLPLVIKLLDPSGPYYFEIEAFINHYHAFFTRRVFRAFFKRDFPRWSSSEDCCEAATLLNIALLTQGIGHVSLSDAFLKGRNLEDLFNSEIEFTMACGDLMMVDHDVYDFRGTFLHVMSLLSWMFSDFFFWMLESCDSPLNEGLLLGASAYHDEGDHDLSLCPLHHLLSKSVDPNCPDLFVTPLQIAARNGHQLAVQELLAAGVDPNGVGNPEGTPFERHHILACYNDVHGLSPLRIYRDGIQEGGHPITRIEELLLEHGAKEFIIEDDATGL